MVIIKEKYGQLGNRLWQFAYLIAFGLENNITISMTDMFFQKPLEPKWESFENMFWSGFRKLFKIR